MFCLRWHCGCGCERKSAGTCCALDSLVLAADIKVGDVVYVAAPGSVATPSTVSTVSTVHRTGRFNVHTLNGNIVVDGVVSSHFTTETTWGADTRSYAPVWYKMVNVAGMLLGAEDARAAK